MHEPPQVLSAPVLGVLLPDGSGAVEVVVGAGADVYAVADGVVTDDLAAGALVLTTGHGTIWTYDGARATLPTGTKVSAGQRIGAVSEGPYVTLSAIPSQGEALDAVAVIVGLPDSAACPPSGLMPDPDDLDGPLSETAGLS